MNEKYIMIVYITNLKMGSLTIGSGTWVCPFCDKFQGVEANVSELIEGVNLPCVNEECDHEYTVRLQGRREDAQSPFEVTI